MKRIGSVIGIKPEFMNAYKHARFGSGGWGEPGASINYMFSADLLGNKIFNVV